MAAAILEQHILGATTAIGSTVTKDQLIQHFSTPVRNAASAVDISTDHAVAMKATSTTTVAIPPKAPWRRFTQVSGDQKSAVDTYGKSIKDYQNKDNHFTEDWESKIDNTSKMKKFFDGSDEAIAGYRRQKECFPWVLHSWAQVPGRCCYLQDRCHQCKRCRHGIVETVETVGNTIASAVVGIVKQFEAL